MARRRCETCGRLVGGMLECPCERDEELLPEWRRRELERVRREARFRVLHGGALMPAEVAAHRERFDAVLAELQPGYCPQRVSADCAEVAHGVVLPADLLAAALAE